MSPYYSLSDADFDRLAPLVPGRPGTRGRSGDDDRRFLDAVVWIARTGAPWRALPPELGRWNSVFQRFNRWSRDGIWHRLFEAVQDPDMEWLLLDSTSIRAHQHAAGARKRGARLSARSGARHSDARAAG
jgi:putative transposase